MGTKEKKILNLTKTKDIIEDEIEEETNCLVIHDDEASLTPNKMFIEDDLLEAETSCDEFNNCQLFLNNKVHNEKRIDESSTNASNNKIIPSASSSSFWSCQTCTFLNDKPIALVCSMCGTIKSCG